jgi:hypothetical protein
VRTRRAQGQLLIGWTVAAVLWLWLAPAPLASPQSASSVPASLSDQAFWTLVESFSEPDGYFQSENLVGNERSLQHVVPALEAMRRGDAYLGVAPDQNFTYIVALQPSIAFIVDIRRGNLLLHLMYKALFELSGDRADLLSRLFARPRPAGLGPETSVEALLEAYWATEPDPALNAATFRAIADRLTVTHGFRLSDDDLSRIAGIYAMFVRYGPALSYSPGTSRGMPTLAEMLTSTDLTGTIRGYLASEASFLRIKDLQQRNLIVPIVGDFAGPKALRSVAGWLREHGAVVRAFYTSNVEQYLFRSEAAFAFYANAGVLPVDKDSVFIRSASRRNVLDPVIDVLTAVREGSILEYWDLARRGTIAP